MTPLIAGLAMQNTLDQKAATMICIRVNSAHERSAACSETQHWQYFAFPSRSSLLPVGLARWGSALLPRRSLIGHLGVPCGCHHGDLMGGTVG